MRNFDNNWTRDNVAKWLIDRALEGAFAEGDKKTPYYKKCMAYYAPDTLSLVLTRALGGPSLLRRGNFSNPFMRSYHLWLVAEDMLDAHILPALAKIWGGIIFADLEEAAWVAPQNGASGVINIRVFCNQAWEPVILEDYAQKALLSQGYTPYNLFWEEKDENDTGSESISGSTEDCLTAHQS